MLRSRNDEDGTIQPLSWFLFRYRDDFHGRSIMGQSLVTILRALYEAFAMCAVQSSPTATKARKTADTRYSLLPHISLALEIHNRLSCLSLHVEHQLMPIISSHQAARARSKGGFWVRLYSYVLMHCIKGTSHFVEFQNQSDRCPYVNAPTNILFKTWF